MQLFLFKQKAAYEIGERSGTDEPSVANAESRRRGRGHLAHGVLEGEDVFVADVLPEDAREGAVGAGMRASLRIGGVESLPVAADDDPRLRRLHRDGRLPHAASG